MSNERQHLESGIAALEVQRGTLGDAMVDALLAPIRERLAALQSGDPAQVLKQVTILFLDVVGSTSLSQHLEPEAIGELMDGALARGTAIVRAHQGRVLQYAGDNLLAAFGADGASEDDAERGVRCGLALLELGRVLGHEVLARHGHAGFGVRVGMHTGRVLLGGGVDAEGSIRGIAVNIAARMEQTAPPGALRISSDTYALVRGMFEIESQSPMVVKGVDVPVHSVLVLRARPRSFRIASRGIEGVSTRMVGREAELRGLQDAFLRLWERPALSGVTVVADAGLGKSRLLYEFETWSDARPEPYVLFRGRAVPQTGTLAFGLLRDLVAWRFQWHDDDRPADARRKIEDGLVPLLSPQLGTEQAQAQAHLLGHLIGLDASDSPHVRGILDDVRQIRQLGLRAAVQMFRGIAAHERCPVVMQLEDLHWADDESLQFLGALPDTLGDLPMLVLAFTRPTLFERWRDWRPAADHAVIRLQPLEPLHGAALAAELLKPLRKASPVLHDLLTRHAEGNPYYMEELVRMFIDQGAIRTQVGGSSDDGGAGEAALTAGEAGGVEGDAAWSVDLDRLRTTQVPATLNGVLQSRLDGLPAAERLALQQASVVGAVFWDQALHEVDPGAAAQLSALAQRELVLPRADAPLEGLREYSFRHHLLHQVVYDTVLQRHKRTAHARVAQWLAGLAQECTARGGEWPGLAAEHFERAGDLGRACEQHARAAELARQRMAHDRVLRHVERGLELLHRLPPSSGAEAFELDHALLRWRLLDARFDVLDMQARRDEQAADLDAMEALAIAMGDDLRLAGVARRRAVRASRMADWAAMRDAATHGVACATRGGDPLLRLLNRRLLASSMVLSGDIEGGEAIAHEVLTEARQRGQRQIEAGALNVLSMAAERRGDLFDGLEFSRLNHLLVREGGDPIDAAIALANLGGARLYVGDLQGARTDLEQALAQLRANGDQVIQAVTLCSLASLELCAGAAREARELAQQARTLSAAVQARDVLVWALLRVGQAEAALGRAAQAREAYTLAYETSVEIDGAWRHEACAGLARVALAEGDGPAALAALRPVLRHDAEGGTDEGMEYPQVVELTCHRVLAAVGDARADTWLQRAHDRLMRQVASSTRFEDAEARRRDFLERIPFHREIMEAWLARSGGAN